MISLILVQYDTELIIINKFPFPRRINTMEVFHLRVFDIRPFRYFLCSIFLTIRYYQML